MLKGGVLINQPILTGGVIIHLFPVAIGLALESLAIKCVVVYQCSQPALIQHLDTAD